MDRFPPSLPQWGPGVNPPEPLDHPSGSAANPAPAGQAPPPHPQPIHQVCAEVKPRLTKEQHDILERHFQQQPKPSTHTKKSFADMLGVPLDKINVSRRRASSPNPGPKLTVLLRIGFKIAARRSNKTTRSSRTRWPCCKLQCLTPSTTLQLSYLSPNRCHPQLQPSSFLSRASYHRNAFHHRLYPQKRPSSSTYRFRTHKSSLPWFQP